MEILFLLIFLAFSLIVILYFRKNQSYFAYHFLVPGRFFLYTIAYVKIIAILVAVISAFVLFTQYHHIYDEEYKKTAFIVLDISHSMENQDIAPSRIDAMKTALKEDLPFMSQHTLGVIVFAGKPFTHIPLTSQREDIHMLIDSIRTVSLTESREFEGTNMGNALLLAIHKLEDVSYGEKEIYLYTDGAATIGFDPLLAAERAKQFGITIHTIAIGKDSKDYDAKLLQTISSVTEGNYREIISQSDYKDVIQVSSSFHFATLPWLLINQIAVFIFLILEIFSIPFRSS